MKSDELLRRVAPCLAQARWPVVYVGGATTHLHIVIDEVRASADDVRQYLREVATAWRAVDAFVDAVEGYLQDAPRAQVVLGKLSELAK
jgi:hypothetical protein